MISKYWRFISPHRSLFISITMLSVITGLGTAVADPLALKILVDALTEGNFTKFSYFAAGFIVIALLTSWLRYLMSCQAKKLQNSIHKTTTLKLSGKFFRKSLNEVGKQGSTYYINRLHDEPRELSQVGTYGAATISRAVQMVASLAVVIYLSWQVTLALLIIAPVLIFLGKHFSHKLKETESARLETDAQFKSILGGFVNGFPFVKLMNGSKQTVSSLDREIEQPLTASYLNTQVGAKYNLLSSMFFSISEISVIIIAGSQVVFGGITIGSLFAFMRSYHIIIGLVDGIASSLPLLIRLNSTIDRYDMFSGETASKGRIPNDKSKNLDNFEINIPSLSFSYHSGEHILSNFKLCVKKQERVLIKGRNGSGKTTLSFILAGLIQVEQQQPTKIPSAREVSAYISSVPFAPLSVGELVLDKRSAWCHDTYIKLLNELSLEKYISTPVLSLSAGQQAKVRIALTLSKNADLYIFDEPLAFVDAQSKVHISDLIKQHTNGKTVLFITHEAEQLFEPFEQIITIDRVGIKHYECE